MIRPSSRLLLIALAGFALGAAAAEQPRSQGPAITDMHGRIHHPLAEQPCEDQRRLTVLLFINTTCPIANSYAPEVLRIIADYAKRPVRFYLVHPEPGVTAEEARRHADEYGYGKQVVLLDRKHDLVKHVKATVTPQAAVLGATGEVLYLGRIDDVWADYGVRRTEPRRRDLRLALDAALAGKPIEQPRTPSIGCDIMPLDDSEDTR